MDRDEVCAHEAPGSAPPPAVQEAIIALYTRPFSRMSIAGRAAVSTTAPHPRNASATLSHALWISTEVGQNSSVAQDPHLELAQGGLDGLGQVKLPASADVCHVRALFWRDAWPRS